MQRNICVFAGLLFLVGRTFAQGDWSVELSAGYLYNQPSGTALDNWRSSWTVGAGAAYRVFGGMELLFDMRFARLPYEGKYIHLVYLDILGERWKVDGEPSSIFESAIGIRISTPGSDVRWFFTVRGGLLVTDIGRIIVSTWMDSQPEKISQQPYTGTGTTLKKGFGSLGVGFRVSLSHSFDLLGEGRFVSTFVGNQAFLPVTLTGQLQL